MRKVSISNLVSLDGYIGGPNGEIDWFVSTVDKEFENYGIELIQSVDTMLFGRVTYQLMESYWPTAKPGADDQKVIDGMNNTFKIVFSKTLQNVGWNNSKLSKGNLIEEVTELKEQEGKNIVIYGSGSIVSQLSPARLIDDYRIFVVPVLLGSGIPMFKENIARIQLKLVETKKFDSGIVLMHYHIVR